MSDIDLKRLRRLRSRAEFLLSTLVSDLRPFRHKQVDYGFRRKPDSGSLDDDVNITTTCSCLMALALSGKVADFYGDESPKTVAETFKHVLKAPWMSSGLSEDNAFTTTLVIRLFGFLVDAGLIKKGDSACQTRKQFESHLPVSDFGSLAHKLVERQDPFCAFLFDLFPADLQKALDNCAKSGSTSLRIEGQTAVELSRLVRSTYFYDTQRFKNIPLRADATDLLDRKLDGYRVAQLNRILLHDVFPGEIKALETKSIEQIALDMSSDPSARFRINEYPASAAVLYWFVDGIVHAQIDLQPEHWDKVCTLASEEFRRQRSLVVAKNAAMMDPVAMAMSACLCARLRTISKDLLLNTTKDHYAMMPSTIELERSVVELFAEQTPGGIWPKYFPLFHYQDAGSNFCFTFELLEAVLIEFGRSQNRVLTEEAVIVGLERAVDWCEDNRLRCSEIAARGAVPYEGWNSGGNFETLRRGQPESWATAVVHMFLWELVDVLSRHIQERLLDNFAARRPTSKWRKVEGLLDIGLWLDRKPASLIDTLKSTIINTFKSFKGSQSDQLRKRPIKNEPLSALLFGPPGTSKTEVAKAIAAELGWPLVEIDPSNFLQDSFQNIYVRAERIFEDVMDLCGVVVLFDEMDALVQKRDADTAPDTESKFLTTYMLPKLAKLHDRGQLVFLMSTNFQASFDDAIKRAGRFDFLLCMGPPTLGSKCKSIHVFFELEKSTEETKTAGETILTYTAADPWLEDQLSLYTYAEFLSLISEIGRANDIGAKVKAITQGEFLDFVKQDSQSVNLKMADLEKLKQIPALSKWTRLKELDTLDFDEQIVKSSLVNYKLPAIKYILDRKQSRRQCVKSAIKI
jgi:ATPase family associated with various cellular activities (AAA)